MINLIMALEFIPSSTEEFYWDDEFPEVGVKGCAHRTVSVTVTISSSTIFSDAIATFNNQAKIDLSDVVREHLDLMGRYCERVVVSFQEGTGSGVSGDIWVVRRKLNIPVKCEDWAMNRFATLSMSKQLPSFGVDTLYFVRDYAADMVVKRKYVYMNASGEMLSRETSETTASPPNPAMPYIEWSVSVQWPSIATVPVAMTISVGNRSMTYYHTDKPCCAFKFRNAFGAWEWFYHPASVIRKNKTESSVAVISGRLRNYDIKAEQKLQVKFGPCTAGEQVVVAQMAESDEIYMWEDVTEKPTDDSISKIRLVAESCEFAHDPESKDAIVPVLKCRPGDGLPTIPARLLPETFTSGIFTQQFTDQFS